MATKINKYKLNATYTTKLYTFVDKLDDNTKKEINDGCKRNLNG